MTRSQTVKDHDHVVLIVEDDAALLEAIHHKLELNGFKTLTAQSVEEAMRQLQGAENVSVVWLDHYLLGDEDGVDFVMRLKRVKRFRSIPIFVVSNTASAQKVEKYLQLGIKKYYVKADHRLDKIVGDIRACLAEGAPSQTK